MNIVFDPEKHFLGKLCRHRHEWENTAQSLRVTDKSGYHRCVICVDLHNRRNTGNAEFHKKRYSEYGKLWYEKNCNRLREVRKIYRQLNREKEFSRHIEYRKLNKEKIRESSKEYYQRNKEKSYINARKRRARKLQNHFTHYSEQDLLKRFEDFKFSCAYCGSKEFLTVDHLIPVSKGGPDCISNLVPACSFCNGSKGNRDVVNWYPKQDFYSNQRWSRLLSLVGKEIVLGQIPLF
ncbi:MAG: HNH endonuclease [Gloeotrichia echinulata DEX184]|jgi:5-methylcytosine-specific restriction endonuclease McrA|nr:HNH endonuclease [Gloeotrichia echinulata DEX184]